MEPESYDQKIVKRHYPRAYKSDGIQFVFDADPNLFMNKNKIAIHLTVEVPKDYLPSNGFGSKLFGKTEVAVNSQVIDNSNSKYHPLF